MRGVMKELVVERFLNIIAYLEARQRALDRSRLNLR
jgi:hypothetical protein